MSERIASYELERQRWPMRALVRNAKAQWTERTSLLVSLHARGRVGYGEAAPLPGYSPASLEQSEQELAAAMPQIVGWDVTASTPRALLTELRSLDLNPCARFALETAVLDLRAKHLGQPLWAVLRSGDLQLSWPAAAAAPVPLSALLLADDEASAVASARAAHDRGIRCGKLKVGGPDPLREEAIARAIRSAMGEGFGLRLDANGMWNAGDLRARLDAFAEVAPEYIEEPADGAVWLGLGDTPVPLAIDESLARPGGIEAMRRLASNGTCQVVTLKLAVVGGFLHAFEIAEEATRLGLDVVVTHMFEGPVASAAAAAFVLALPRHARCAGLDVQPYATWTGAQSAWCTPDGVIAPWKEPGLGDAAVSTTRESC